MHWTLPAEPPVQRRGSTTQNTSKVPRLPSSFAHRTTNHMWHANIIHIHRLGVAQCLWIWKVNRVHYCEERVTQLSKTRQQQAGVCSRDICFPSRESDAKRRASSARKKPYERDTIQYDVRWRQLQCTHRTEVRNTIPTRLRANEQREERTRRGFPGL
jgi:hypothetical protein